MNAGRRGSDRERHLDTAVLLDYLEGRLDGPARGWVEEHLGSSCGTCRERLRAVERLLGAMQSDRTPEVPDALRRIARAAYVPPPAPAPAPSLIEQAVRLVFDSFSDALPALARRAVGEARRLRFGLDGHALELEIEREDADAHTVRGCLLVPGSALHHITLVCGDERRTAWPADTGEFAFERVPAGHLTIEIAGPEGHWRVPPIEVEP